MNASNVASGPGPRPVHADDLFQAAARIQENARALRQRIRLLDAYLNGERPSQPTEPHVEKSPSKGMIQDLKQDLDDIESIFVDIADELQRATHALPEGASVPVPGTYPAWASKAG